MIQLAVHGWRGRTGSRVCALAREDERFELIEMIGRDDPLEKAGRRGESCDVVIDFSSDEGALRAARIAIDDRAALVVGTTGLSRENRQVLDHAARSIPVLIAPNMSPGVAVLNRLAVETARILGDEFDIDLIETHHAAKRDAPSGTAVHLVDLLRDQAGAQVPPGRVHSIRAGDVVGEHFVCFTGRRESLKIFHSAATRDVFAEGALRAAAWIVGKRPGRYTIEDSLGLTGPSE